jgi:hypothetical protein
VCDVTKVRLFSLLILLVSLSAYFGLFFRPGGFSDGGYW